MKRTWGFAVLAAVTLAGCSQAAQLQPVAGGAVTAVRMATNDVLVEKKVDILEAPVCEVVDPENFRCVGKATNGEIVSTSKTLAAYGATTNAAGVQSDADMSLEVSVAGQKIFTGKVYEVINENAQVAP